MSQQCATIEAKLETLDPFYVEVHQPGVLRRIRSNEAKVAQGFCFLCPRCKHDKEKKHYVILLFQNAPEKSRPHGRFYGLTTPQGQLLPAAEQSMKEISEFGMSRTLLKPQDLKCRWEGHVVDGKVHWRPSFIERLRRT
jgi:hypothetical protein